MKSILLPLLFLSTFGLAGHAQTVVQGRLLDAGTREPVMYGSVGMAKNGQGTISNAEGYFRVPAVSGTDTLTVSCIGYHTRRLAFSQWPGDGNIYLERRAVSLKTATVTFDNYLYTLLAACKSAKTQPAYTAKTYFVLDSYIDDQPVEMLECYYNGRYRGSSIEGLDLKNGRIFLAQYKNQFFSNIETSKAIISLYLLANNDYFPTGPLELSKKNLVKAYNLHLLEKYRDEGTIYAIEFTPKEDDGRFFGGQVWVDSASKSIIKINLKASDARPHPFIPMWSTERILRVDLDIDYNFKKRNGQYVFDVVDFKYDLAYKGRGGQQTVRVNGVLYAYGHEEQFILPYFNYDMGQSDYRKITSFPYNGYFWENRDSIVTTGRQRKNLDYFLSRGYAFNSNLSAGADKNYFEEPRNNFFQDNYIYWKEDRRLQMKSFADTTKAYNMMTGVPADRYNLQAQLYMDINPKADTLYTVTGCAFDVFSSYYYMPMDSLTDCFLNIYFDLFEIERRELEKDLRKPGLTVADMEAIYKQHVAHVNELGDRFKREAVRGENRDALIKWNQYVNNRLKIDNLWVQRNMMKDEK